MSNPKEKAEELLKKMASDLDFVKINLESKRCALIACDEIINNFGTRTTGQEFYTEYRAVEYYQQVKNEIEKL